MCSIAVICLPQILKRKMKWNQEAPCEMRMEAQNYLVALEHPKLKVCQIAAEELTVKLHPNIPFLRKMAIFLLQAVLSAANPPLFM